MRIVFILASIIGLAHVILATPVLAEAPYGTWLRPSTGGKIEAFQCGGGFGLKVVASKDRAKVGQVIMYGARSTGGNNYGGSIKNLEDGNTYTGKVEIIGNSMNLSGCGFGGLICKTETWRRTK